MAATGITSIRFVSGIGKTPARVNRETGELQLNAETWAKLDPDHRYFILLHELGHVALQTQDELKADEFAFKHYARKGRSLKKSISGLTHYLGFNRPEHYDRLYAQFNRAAAWDYHQNKNAKMGNFIADLYESNPFDRFAGDGERRGGLAGVLGTILDYTPIGLIANALPTKEQRQERFNERQETKQTLAVTNAQAQQAMAMSADATARAVESQQGTEQKKIFGYVAIGLGVLIVAGLVFYLLKKKK